MKRRSLKQDKLARVYDTEIMPIWSQRFGRMLLAEAKIPKNGLVLNVACGTGYPGLDLLEKMDGGRIIAIDSSSALLDVARGKAEDLSGKRIFFRTEGGKDKLSFDKDVYDLTFTNLGLGELQMPPREALAELTRVTAPGGQVLVTMPLRGTWGEFLDIYREVLTKHDRHDTLQSLNEYEADIPEPEAAIEWLEAAGLTGVDLVVDEFSLLFKSSREFFFAPVIEFGPLRDWKQLAGKGQEMQDIFWYIKESIDAYFGDRAFSVTVVAGCLCGFKPEESEEDAGGPPPEIRPGRQEENGRARPRVREADRTDDDAVQDVIVTHPTLSPSAVALLGEADISIHELDAEDLEEIEDTGEVKIPGDDDLDTGVRDLDDLPDHLRQAIADSVQEEE